MHFEGQLSLEYLLLLAVVFSAFAFLLPVLNNVFATNLFGLDSVNAKQFSQNLQQAVEEMSFQADGSTKSFEANPFSHWVISSAEEKLFVSVQGPGREKVFEVSFPNKISVQASLKTKASFLLKKESGKILLEYG